MRLLKNFNRTLVVVLALFALSCTRAAKDSTSQINFSLAQSPGSNGTLAADSLIHVSINVTGGGINAPIVLNWDRDNNGSAAAAATTSPTSFSLDVPQGPDRLVQVLAVYGDSSGSGAMQFYYGDVTQSLSNATENVTVPVASVAQSATVVSGNIQGRYFTSANNGPTGRVDIVYAPPGGKNPMVIERSMMMSGWFQFFGLIGAQLGYRLENGTYLWGGSVDLSETTFPVSSRVLRVAIPIHLKQDSASGGTTTTRQEEPNVYIYGFFGDSGAVSSKSICKSTGTGLTRLLKIGTTSPLGVADDGSADPANLFDTTLANINVRGGVSLGGAAPCDTQVNITANRFGSALAFVPSMLDNGSDNAAGFRLPFQLPQSTNNGGGSALVSTVVDANNISVSGTFLPGASAELSSFAVFKATNLGKDFHYHSSYAPCSELAGMGYSKVADTPVSGDTYSATLPLTDAEATGGAMFALCPMKSGAPIGPGVWVNASYMRGNSGGCSGCGGSATQLATILIGNKVANSVCTPFFVEGRDASNYVASFSGPVALTFTVDNADTVVYSDSYCSTAVSVPYSTFGSSQMLYLKRTSTGAVARNLTVSSSLPTVSQPLNFVDSSGTPFIKARVPSLISAYGCYTASYVSMLQNGADTMVANLGSSYSFYLPTISGLSYYYNSGAPCSTSGSNSISLGSSGTISSINFLYTGNASSIDLNPVSASPTFSGTYTGGSPINVNQPGGAAFVQLSLPPSISAESCMPANLRVMDSMYNLTPAPQAFSLNFTFNGSGSLPTNAGFYSDPSCNSPTSPPSIAAGTTMSSSVYFRWPASGSLSIAASIVSGPTGLSYQSQTITVGSPAVGSIVAYPANGVSFAWPNTFTGYALPVQKNQPFTITLEARSPLGNLLVAFNDSNAGPSGVNIQDQYSNLTCGSIIWATGMGSVNCSVPSAPDYFSSIMDQLRTGGGASMYPMFAGNNSIRVSRAAEDPNTMSFLLSKPFSYYSNICQPLMFTRGQYTGSYFVSSRVVSSPYTANLTYNTGVTGFYSDASCASTITQSSLATGQSANLIYVKMSGTAPSNNLAMQADSVGVSDSGTTALAFSNGSPPSSFSQYTISMSLNQYYRLCSPVMIVRADTNGTAVSAGAADNVTLSSNFAASWYSDPSCGTALTSNMTAFNVGETAKIVYMRPDVMNFSAGTVNVTNGTQTGSTGAINGQP